MWEWREGGPAGAGSWQLTGSGSWTWDDPSVLWRGLDALEARPVAPGSGEVPPARAPEEETPIFRAVAEDQADRRTGGSVPARRHRAPEAAHDAAAAVWVPDPGPGSGPLPIARHTSADVAGSDPLGADPDLAGSGPRGGRHVLR